MERRVVIVGAGISGLLACKCAVEKGFDPLVFEAGSRVGGIWVSTPESTRLQNVKAGYRFSDLDWPDSVREERPPSTQVLEYIDSYVERFGLLPYVRFNSRVTSIDYVGESEEEVEGWDQWGGTGSAFGSIGKWHVHVRDENNNAVKEYRAEFVILCLGRFSGIANIPDLPPDRCSKVFGGRVVHSMEYSAMENASALEMIKGKRVTIVGSLKSALDIAVECANVNGVELPCTMIQRTPHWLMPRDCLLGKYIGYLYFNRFSELLIHKPGENTMLSLVAMVLSPLRWTISKLSEIYLRWTLPLRKYQMIPPHSFYEDLSSCQIGILPEGFYNRVKEGSIILRRARSFGFNREGVITDEGAGHFPSDVVILATGFRGDQKLQQIFRSPHFQKHFVGSTTAPLPLYRQMIHPRIPQLAVIGYAEGIANLPSFEIRCRWLAQFLDRKFQLPAVKDMEEDVSRWQQHMNRYAGRNSWRSCVVTSNIWYNDQLCKDMGCNPRRKKGFWAEWFQPYGPMDYAAIYRSGFKGSRCNKSHSSKDKFRDLTLTAGKDGAVRVSCLSCSRSPLVLFLYERGWCQHFNRSGIPGPDKEFLLLSLRFLMLSCSKMAQEYFKPAEGGFLVDVSCESGLFTRKFAKSGNYSGVIALDFSKNILSQSYDLIEQDETILTGNLSLVRADVARLPFSSGAVDAVHAGAAIHCCPSPSTAAKINFCFLFLCSRRVFLGTTFLCYSQSTPSVFRLVRSRILQNFNFGYLTAEEIEDLCTSCSLTNYRAKSSSPSQCSPLRSLRLDIGSLPVFM
ncbi:hypothetical protein MLD38_006673 [Melastoma candidum]|uniref:Uncharacterized protein n=1 Tax=Melastoma candidum TaxID=119954 RepID=A0ACB9RNA9_9MYRT|nr:hypothetical protein MLD38_006673 [Melastoma candidum]